MKRLNLMVWLLGGMLLVASCDDDDDNNDMDTVSDADRTFVMNAADGGMFEVRAGEMAVAKGDSVTMYAMHDDSMSVKSFGQMMITDHTKANDELKGLADRKNVTVPTTLSAAKQQKLDSLSKVSGAAFNVMYAKMMVASHKETVDLFEKQRDSGNDSDLRNWAGDKLPTLEHHLEMSEMLNDEMN